MRRGLSAWWRGWFGDAAPADAGCTLADVNRQRAHFNTLDDATLKVAAAGDLSLAQTIALGAVAASRRLRLDMFDVQIEGALALANGRIAEMQTGEGKTLAAVPAVIWYARQRKGVHVLTANDYLARRDADWMHPIYEWFGLSVGVIQQNGDSAARRAAYRADVTYAAANEIGFDYLRDCIALSDDEQVHRPFNAVVVDEADSILIDEARIPLVLAGGRGDDASWSVAADSVVRTLIPMVDFSATALNVALTPRGVARVEQAFRVSNLYDTRNLARLSAVQDALHAHALLRKDVDYVVLDGAILPVDEFKGRTVPERRWPAGLQTAIEVKERLAARPQGRILGSITIQNLIGLYPTLCGMTGTAATQAEEFRTVYGLEVQTIPTNRPLARVDLPDVVFPTRTEKDGAVVEEIRRLHASGRPVLVGTASVEESERLSRRLDGLRHEVLNARHEAAEAGIIARAGERDAITISTNMAGRGVDIRLGPGVAELGGLHVIGTNRHDSRRIDNQLRGRAGRQGDPGSSQFFVSAEDPLVVRYAADDTGALDLDHVQRIVEGQHLDLRLFLRKYESILEGQRLVLQADRQKVLGDRQRPEIERVIALTTIDDLWSDYLAAVTELRQGVIWISLGGGDPMTDFVHRLHGMFAELNAAIAAEIDKRLQSGQTDVARWRERGATWTYLTTDEPFGSLSERAMRGLANMVRRKFGSSAT